MAQTWVTTFYDEFTDGFVGLHTQTGNGEIVETGGRLQTKTLGADCRWWNDGQSAPVAYMIFPDVTERKKGLWWVETKLPALTYTNNNTLSGLVVWQDRDNGLWIGWYPNDQKIYVQIGTNDSWSTAYTSSAVVAPNTSAHFYRIYFNHSDHALTVVNGSQVLPPNTASLWFCTDGIGTTWNHAYTYSSALGFVPLRYGIFTRNWSAYPTVVASWEYLKLQLDLETDVEQRRNREQFAGSRDFAYPRDESSDGYSRFQLPHTRQGIFPGRQSTDPAVLDDHGTGLPAARSRELSAGATEWHTPKDDSSSEPPRFTHPQTRRGLYAGRARDLSSRESRFSALGDGDPMVEREQSARASDSYALISLSGPPRFTLPQRGIGLAVGDELRGLPAGSSPFVSDGDPRVRREIAARVRERCVLYKPTYDLASWINDGDGRALLSGIDLRQVFYYDPTDEPWGSPGAGFHGAAASGKFYVDGAEAGPALNGTTFGTLVGGFNRKTWMNDVEPNAAGSNVTNPTLSLVADDTIRIAGTLLSSVSKGVFSRMRWCLVGDFDIQINFANYASAGGTDGGGVLMARLDENTLFYVRRWGNTASGRIDSNVHINGGTGNYVYITTSVTSGKFRLVRSGSTVTTYYDIGAGWVLLRSAITNSALALPMDVQVYMDGYGNVTSRTIDFSAFTINSGTVANTAGWSREAAGTHRGARGDFPVPALIVPTKSGLDIVDLSTSKLWMRFVCGSGNAHSTTMPPRRVSMKNGVLLSADDGGGGVLRIDFTTDDIRVHAAVGETWTGGILRATNGVYTCPANLSGRDVGPHGIIASRNAGLGYQGDRDNWRIPSSTVYGADLYESGEYLYEVCATASGLGVTKWRRWYFDGASPANWSSPAYWSSALTDAARWVWVDPDTGYLYWATATTLYSAAPATWTTVATGGTFAADASRALPGTRHLYGMQGHYRPVIQDGNAYVASVEGVWVSTWPAAFSLLYGPPASGAAQEILPPGSVPAGLLGRKYVDGSTYFQLIILLEHSNVRPMAYPTFSGRSWRNLLVVNLADHSIAHQRQMSGSRLVLADHEGPGLEA